MSSKERNASPCVIVYSEKTLVFALHSGGLCEQNNEMTYTGGSDPKKEGKMRVISPELRGPPVTRDST